ncbi:bis-aminopropyl spermidine synthase family protein [Rhodopseudomonas palustris]|nr:bis-aminopropyl spermidine synthase family protein [Rhodopseudomonas palustris]
MTDPAILRTIAEATRLREGPAGVEAILRAVYRAGSLRLQDAAREARLPMPIATAVRRELEKAGLLERKQGLALSPEGRDFVERELGLGTAIDVTCPACSGHGVVIPENFHAQVVRLAAIIAQAPSVDVTLDQAPCTPETSLLRALLMLQAGALEGRRVLLLGDDDSVSLSIGLVSQALGKGDLTRGVVVVDADERRLAFLRDSAAREGIALRTVHHDLRQPLPAELQGAFDTIETDPPYTLEGAKLFLTRGREALAGDGLCYFSFAQWPPRQMLALQRVFLDLGLAVQTIRPGFNAYAGATVLGNVGQLIELAAAGPAAAALPAWQGPLYTAEVNPRIRAYVCTQCGRESVLGRGSTPETIEALKEQGCANCGGHSFRRKTGGT